MDQENKYIINYKHLQELLTKKALLVHDGITLSRNELLQLIKDTEVMSFITSKYTKSQLHDKLINLELILEDIPENNKEGRDSIIDTIKITQATYKLYKELRKEYNETN